MTQYASYNFKLVDSLVLAGGEDNPIVSAAGGGYLYVTTDTSPGIITKIDLATFTEVAALTLESGEDSPYGLSLDLAHGFGYASASAVVVKFRLSNMQRIGAVSVGSFAEQSLILGNYLYVISSDAPSVITKINLTSFTVEDSVTLAAGENSATSLITDGTYLYAGCYTSPVKIVKVRASDLVRIGVLVGQTGENSSNFGAVADDKYGYVPLDSGHIFKFKFSNFKREGVLTLGAGFSPNSIVLDAASDYGYIGCCSDPAGKVVRFKISEFALRSLVVLSGTCCEKISFANGYVYAPIYYLPDPGPTHIDKIDVTGLSAQLHPRISFRLNLETGQRFDSSLPYTSEEANNFKYTRSSWLANLLKDNYAKLEGDIIVAEGTNALYLKNNYTTGDNPLLIVVSE